MSVAIVSPTPYINKWQMSLCNNSSDNKSYWIHRVDVKVSAQVTTVTYMHQSQPSLHSLRKHFTVHLQLWPGNHFIWCNATYMTTQRVREREWERARERAREREIRCRHYMGYSFWLAAMVLFMHHPTWIAHSTAYVTPIGVHHEESIRRPIAPWANALTTCSWFMNR